MLAQLLSSKPKTNLINLLLAHPQRSFSFTELKQSSKCPNPLLKLTLKELGKRGYGSVQVVGIEGKILKIEAREEEFAVVTADGMTGIHPYGTMMMYIPQKAASNPASP